MTLYSPRGVLDVVEKASVDVPDPNAGTETLVGLNVKVGG